MGSPKTCDPWPWSIPQPIKCRQLMNQTHLTQDVSPTYKAYHGISLGFLTETIRPPPSLLQRNTVSILRVSDNFCFCRGFEMSSLSCVTLLTKPHGNQKKIHIMGRESPKHGTSQGVAPGATLRYHTNCNTMLWNVVPCITLGLPEWNHNLGIPFAPLPLHRSNLLVMKHTYMG